MKAIVLTYDKYHIFAAHTIKMYMKLWPENPFIFRVPFNNSINKTYFNNNKVEFIQTDKHIKKTVLKLIEDLPDEEWVFWCIDDEYLIDINKKKIKKIIDFINKEKVNNIDGICPIKLPEFLPELKIKFLNTDLYFYKKDFSFIWVHQFLKVKVLRYIFENLPDSYFPAKKMDYFIKNIKINELKLIFSNNNFLFLGESTTRGEITKNCYESLKKHKFEIPENFKIFDKTIFRSKNVILKNKKIYFNNIKTLIVKLRYLLQKRIFEKFALKIFDKRIKNEKVIFCINSGRVGSKYLAELLNHAKNTAAYHEPYPQMNKIFVHFVNEYNIERSKSKRIFKVNAIKEKIFYNYFKGKNIYVETTHMFIKTFYDVVIENFKNIEVIILRRNFLDTLKSFVELGYFSKYNSNWEDWMTSPNAKTSVVKAIKSDEEMDQIELCIAYLIDIEGRIEKFKKEYPEVKYHEIRLEELNDAKKVFELMNKLGLKPKKGIERLIGKKVNNKKNEKNIFYNVDKEYLKTRLKNYIETAINKKIELPKIILNIYNNEI